MPHAHTNSGEAVSGEAVSAEAVAATGSTTTDDKGLSLIMNGHQHEREVIPMDSVTTALLARQLARTAELVTFYPTVADAEAAGYRRQGPYSPGLGTHYGKGGDTLVGATITDDNVLDPMLIFDGTDPTSKLAGFMYIVFGVAGVPEGFQGRVQRGQSGARLCRWHVLHQADRRARHLAQPLRRVDSLQRA